MARPGRDTFGVRTSGGQVAAGEAASLRCAALPAVNQSLRSVSPSATALCNYRVAAPAPRVPPTAPRVPPTAPRVPPTAPRVPPTMPRVPPTMPLILQYLSHGPQRGPDVVGRGNAPDRTRSLPRRPGGALRTGFRHPEAGIYVAPPPGANFFAHGVRGVAPAYYGKPALRVLHGDNPNPVVRMSRRPQ